MTKGRMRAEWAMTPKHEKISAVLWMAVAIAMFVLCAYQAWDTFDQRQRVNAIMTDMTRHGKIEHRKMDMALARWQKINKQIERDNLMKPQGKDY